MIKSAASAASLGFAGERQDDGPACGRRGMERSPANPRGAAQAADLITASLIDFLAVPGQYRSSPTILVHGPEPKEVRVVFAAGEAKFHAKSIMTDQVDHQGDCCSSRNYQ